MSNLVTVNSGSAINGTLKAGRISISTDSTVSPTSDWYNLINPAEGYTFITDSEIQGYGFKAIPLIYPTQTSLPADILATINGLPDRVGSVPFDNVWDALVWVQSTGKYFILDKTSTRLFAGEPELVIDGASLSSYPQSGSTAFDLSGNDRNGTLVNGVSWNENGYFVFDGTDDRIDFTEFQLTGDWTISYFYYHDEVTSNKMSLGTKDDNNSRFYHRDTGVDYRLRVHNAAGNSVGDLVIGTINGSGRQKWGHIAYSMTSTHKYGWVNGQNNLDSTHSLPTTFDFNCIGDGYNSSETYHWNGNLTQVVINNKKLTDQEVNQLYYGSNIVTNGLIYALDPSNLVSYPKTGTTVYSLTGSNSATLSNGIGFENSFGGEFTFDGTDDYINASFDTLPSNGGSIEVWVKRKSTTTNAFVFGKVGTSTNRYYLRQPTADTLDAVRGNPLSAASFGTLNPNEYYHLVMAWDSSTIYAYKDGVLQDSAAYTNPGTDITDGLIGDGPGNHMEMDLAQFRLYNKTLSLTEVTQNYNAEYSRFKSSRDITKDGLGLQITPSNPDSYLSGTTISDLSGNGRDGTLINNPTFLVENGGIIEFDGTDDYIDFGSLAGTFISDPASNGGVISFSIWVYAVGGYYIMSSGSQTSSRGIAISYQNGSPFISIRTGAKQQSYSPGANFPTGQWIHWVAVSDNTNWVIYKDGVQISSQALGSDSVADAQTKLTIGVPNNAVTNYHFEGKVGDVAFWDTALTAQDVSNLYTSQAPRYRVQTPRSVTDTLKLNLDAGDITSYPRTRTTWYDRSGNGNNATLYNSPTYTIAEGGVFDLDGTDDYFIAPASAAGMYNFGTDGTLEMWFRPDASYTTNHRLLCVTNNASAIDVYINPSGELRLHGNQAYATQTVPINEWTHLVITYVGGNVQIYFNGEAQTMAGTKLTGYNITNNSQLFIGQFSGGGSYYFNGKIANTKIYHRGLNPSEVLENYKSTRSRFEPKGLPTTNLLLHWDASNPDSYDGSSTTIYDLSGNGYHGTLYNGVGFDAECGGALVFDGVNDYVYSNSTAPDLRTTDCTIIGVARYISVNTGVYQGGGRTINGQSNNWLMGHWDRSAMKYFAQGWVTDSAGTEGAPDTNLYIYHTFNKPSTDQWTFYRDNVLDTGPNSNGSQGPYGFTIGKYGTGSSEYSNSKFYTLLVYDTILSNAEVTQVYNYLRNRFGKN